MSRTHLALGLCGFLVTVSLGCGDGLKLYPVSGTITYEDKPLEGASVLYIPQGGPPGVGTTDASGKYTITTTGKPGAALGTYTVTVSKQAAGSTANGTAATLPTSDATLSEEEMKKQMQDMTKMMKDRSKEKVKSLVPVRYSMPTASDLRATVTTDEAKNVFDFPLKP